MRKLFVLLFLSCKQATRLASDARQRKLTLSENFRLRLHMRLCLMCRRWEDQVALVEDLLEEYPEVLESPVSPLKMSLPEDAKEQMREALQRARSVA